VKEQVFAIVRYDGFQSPQVPIENRITVTKVIYERSVADSEVKRLNAVNGEKGCVYFWQATRVEG
jgi:hypothetical protein